MKRAPMHLAILFLVAGCSSAPPPNETPQPSTLTDTTGARVSWSCTTGHCAEPMPLGGTPAPRPTCIGGGVIPGYGALVFGNRIAKLCEGCYSVDQTSFNSEGSGCRPIVCSADADCPQPSFGPAPFACQSGLCQDATTGLEYGDVLALCLATVPRSQTQDSQSSAASAASAQASSSCPSATTCTTPSSCRQP